MGQTLNYNNNTFKVFIAVVKILSSVEWHNGTAKQGAIFVFKETEIKTNYDHGELPWNTAVSQKAT